MENDDIVASLCILIMEMQLKQSEKDRVVGDNVPDLGYKGKVNIELILHLWRHL